MDETLRCYDCKQQLPHSAFALAKTTKRGYQAQCRECTAKRRDDPEKRAQAVKRAKRHREDNWEQHKDYTLQRAYGLSYDAYRHMKMEQEDKCAICETHEKDSPKGLVVDHCHETGKVRRLLCSHCNTGLGHFKDNPQLLKLAAEYLEDQWIRTSW